MKWSEDCGRPAANAYCRAQGFVRATWFQPEKHIGARSPTRLIGTGATCDLAHCDGFRQITCLKQTIATAPQETPLPPRIGVARLDRDTGTKVASAGPMMIVPPIPTPRPVLVAARLHQAVIREVKPEPAIAAAVVQEEKIPVGAEAKIEPVEAPSDTTVVDTTTTDTTAVASAKVEESNPAKAPKIFDKPMYNGKRLAWCHDFDADCGKPAADAFCKVNGFTAASEFSLDPHIGDVAPTRSIGSGAVCDQAPCDGFKLIACAM